MSNMLADARAFDALSRIVLMSMEFASATGDDRIPRTAAGHRGATPIRRCMLSHRKSPKITRAALCPGAPVTPPPGCAPEAQ